MKAAPCSPWHDNLRHRYEAGARIIDLAYWHNISPRQMIRWLELAGTKFRNRKGIAQ